MTYPDANAFEPRKYRIFLSSTFKDLRALRASILESWRDAGLFFYAMEHDALVDEKTLVSNLREEIRVSDVFVILLRESRGSKSVGGKPFVELEFEFARDLGKPILAYCTDEGDSEHFSSSLRLLKERVLGGGGRYRRLESLDRMPGMILADVLGLLMRAPPETAWVRAPMSLAEIKCAASEYAQLQQSLNTVQSTIDRLARDISAVSRDRLLGPLIEGGYYANPTKTAYRFAKATAVHKELGGGDLEFEYCIERFLKYPGPIRAVYDRKLDVTWFLVSDLRFTWQEAQDWIDTSPRADEHKHYMGKPRGGNWSLPSIGELMTLVTAERVNHCCMDARVFPESKSVHWFWSSTMNRDVTRAYYLETELGQVLSDSVSHRKGLIAKVDGKLEGPEPQPFLPVEPNVIGPHAVLASEGESRRIFSVYRRFGENGSNREITDKLDAGLLEGGYYVSAPDKLGARPGDFTQIARQELRSSDCYLVASSGLVEGDDRTNNEIRFEASCAREYGLPILMVEDLPHRHADLARLVGSAKLAAHLSDASGMVHRIINAMQQMKEQGLFRGWIRRTGRDRIQDSVRQMATTFGRLHVHERHVDDFLKERNRADVRANLERLEALSRKPDYGECSHFASKHNPLEWLRRGDPPSVQKPPIIYTRYLNRFSPVSGQEHAVQDKYLEKTWLTAVRKALTYPEAEAFAGETKHWRLPTIQELMTLVTLTRGRRKYMDEVVFSAGRWYWSSTNAGEEAFYLDFNYPHADLSSKSSNLAVSLRKSALLISND